MTSLTIDEAGEGRPVFIIHGGGGPRTVAMISAHVARSAHALTPVLPGWEGTERPAALRGVGDYADVFLGRLADRGLADALVIGSSVGGWIAAEMAVRDRGEHLAGVVLIDAAGIEVPEEPVTDFFALGPREIAEHSFHDPDRFFVDPATLTAEQRATQAANIATLREIAGDMQDPGLRPRLGEVRIPALVVWGDSDRVFTPGYGRAYAAALRDAPFELVRDAGHLPQLEQPEATLALLDGFAASALG